MTLVAQTLQGHECEQGVVVKAGRAAHAGSPLGLHGGEQLENLVVFRPHLAEVIVVVGQGEPGAGQ